MKRTRVRLGRIRLNKYWIVLIGLAGLAVLLAALLGAGQGWLHWVLAGLGLAALAVSLFSWFRIGHSQAETQPQADQAEAALKRRLHALQRINRAMAVRDDENGFMHTVLEVSADLTDALSSSYVPLDECSRPLQAFAYGQIPQPLLRGWAEHLASNEVRDRCQQCQDLQASSGAGVCPLLSSPFDQAFSITCLPVRAGDVTLGMLNLYLRKDTSLPADDLQFLNQILDSAVPILAGLGKRSQKENAQGERSQGRTGQVSLTVLLNGLVESAAQAMAARYVFLRVKSFDRRQEGLQLIHGAAEEISAQAIESLWETVLQPAGRGIVRQQVDSPRPHWLSAVSLRSPSNDDLGLLAVAHPPGVAWDESQRSLLEMFSRQCALLIEHERLTLLAENEVILQERTRLSREIHDGLAQTLAFLKLQTAQMQRLITKKDYASIEGMLSQNHKVLTDAYLDARQAIEHLRLTPQRGVEQWLKEIVKDFEATTGVPADFSLVIPGRDMLPEVQTQLIRIVQEALTNVRKHAQAGGVWVSLHEWQQDLILEVGDNGAGFEPEGMSLTSRYGLRGMRERAELIGADFQIISKPGGGTIIRVRIPAYEEMQL